MYISWLLLIISTRSVKCGGSFSVEPFAYVLPQNVVLSHYVVLAQNTELDFSGTFRIFGSRNRQYKMERRNFSGFQARSQYCGKRLLASSCLSVCSSAWNNWAPTRRIFMKFDICGFSETLLRKIKVSIQSDKNNGCFTARPIHIFYNISLISS